MEASALFFPSCHFIGPTLAPAVLYALFYQFTVPHSSNPLIRRGADAHALLHFEHRFGTVAVWFHTDSSI